MLHPVRLLLVLFVLLALPASAAHAAPATVDVAGESFSPGDVSIETGETVTWNFTSSGHNVKGEGFSGNNSFGKGTYTATFTKAGTFSYVCEAHPTTMKGTVKVTAPAAAAAPAPTTTSSAPADGSAPAGAAAADTPWAFPTVDRAAPVLTVLRAKAPRRARRVVLTVRVDQDATVVVAHGRKVLRLRGRRGVNRFTLPARTLRGRRLKVLAVDKAGNESAVTTTTLR